MLLSADFKLDCKTGEKIEVAVNIKKPWFINNQIFVNVYIETICLEKVKKIKVQKIDINYKNKKILYGLFGKILKKKIERFIGEELLDKLEIPKMLELKGFNLEATANIVLIGKVDE